MELVKRLSKVKKPVLIGVGIAVLAVIALMIFLVTRANAQGQTTSTTVQSATAEKGSIASTVTGTGTLASGTTTDVVVPTGITVKEVLVESGDDVVAGQELASLDQASVASSLLEARESLESVEDEIGDLSSDASDSSTTEYLQALILYGEQEDLEEKIAALTTLLDNPVITASTSGTIGTVNVSAGAEVTKSSSSGSSSSSSSDSSDSDASTSGSTASTSTASQADGEAATTSTAAYVLGSSSTSSALYSNLGAGASWTSVVYNEATLTTALQLVTEDATVTMDDSGTALSGISLDVNAPVAGEVPQTTIDESGVYTGTISWNCSTDRFQGNSVYTATIKLTAKEGYTFFKDIVPEVAGATVTSNVLSSESGSEASVLLIKAQFARTGEGDTDSAGSTTSSDNATGSPKSSATTSSDNVTNTTNTGTSGSSGSSSQNASSDTTSSTTEDDASSSGSSSTYGINEAAAFTIVSNDDATVSISVDEADILSVEEGQDVTVTFDAIENQEFEGTITKVSTSTSSSSSGSAKYTAVVTLEKSDEMLLGMSASATINVSESDDAVLIPVSALQERGTSSFVYTELDSEGNPTNEVEVDTGLSNGSQVEITSGLSEGDTVYYTKTESSTTETESGMGFGGGEMSGGGEMPSDGEMPSGSGEIPSGGMGGSASSSRQSQ